MTSLIATYGITTVILILLVGIPAIVNFVSWCKNLWKQREDFKKENFNKGVEKEKKIEEQRHSQENIEDRVTELEAALKDMLAINQAQTASIEMLKTSDMLRIKAWIKEQHEKWMVKGWIDIQALDLLCQQHEIYHREGGNSWADKLIEDLKGLPAFASAQLADIALNNQINED